MASDEEVPKHKIIDSHELAVRIAEAYIGKERPDGMTASEVMADLYKSDADVAIGFQRAAFAAVTYLSECMNEGDHGAVELKVIRVPDGAGDRVI